MNRHSLTPSASITNYIINRFSLLNNPKFTQALFTPRSYSSQLDSHNSLLHISQITSSKYNNPCSIMQPTPSHPLTLVHTITVHNSTSGNNSQKTFLLHNSPAFIGMEKKSPLQKWRKICDVFSQTFSSNRNNHGNYIWLMSTLSSVLLWCPHSPYNVIAI